MKLNTLITAGAIGLAGLVSATDANAKQTCEKRSDRNQVCIAKDEARIIVYQKGYNDSYLLCTVSVSEKGKETEYADLGCTGKATSIVVINADGTDMKARNGGLIKLFADTIDPEYKKLVTLARGEQ